MNVLVTGCRSGFGLLTAIAAARAGHTVYAGLRDLGTAGDLKAAAGDLPVHPVQLDVTDAEQRERVVARIVDEQGGVDALVNNAGIALGGPLEEISEDELRKVFEVNVFAVWALTNLVLPSMREKGGGIVVNVSSMSGRMALPCLGAYAATKHALTALTEALRFEVHDFGIRVVLVEPGPYKTDIFGRNRTVARNANQADSPYADLVGRLDRMSQKAAETAGDAQDVADRIVALLTDPNPGLRHPMGPMTVQRRIARWALPQKALEGLVNRMIARG